ARDKPPHPPDVELTVTTSPSVMRMFRDKSVWILSFGFFAGFGIFIGLTAILEELLLSLGLPVTSGLGSPAIVMLLLLVMGIIGAILVPAISEKVQKRKPFIIVCLAIASVAVFIVGTSTMEILTYIMSAVLGFFLIAVMPIGLSILEELDSVGPELSGASTGLAFWFGNLGGFSASILLELMRVGPSYFYSILYLFIAIAIATILMFFIPETGHREAPT
ncbi:MAG: MFS transporter, partial [Candidatus Thorarchaeota archaeon]